MRLRRRFVLAILTTAFVLPPAAALAQQPAKVWKIGMLQSRRRQPLDKLPRLTAFVRRLGELGYVEGKNLAFEWRFAEDDYVRLPGLAAELVASRVDLIVCSGSEGVSAAQKATKTVPTVFVGGTDVVAQGFVKSLSRPGGNTTGITVLFGDIVGKQVELLRTLVPKASRIAVLFNSTNPASREQLGLFEAAGRTSGAQVVPIAAPAGSNLEDAFARVAEARVDALIWALDNFLLSHESELADLAARYRIPCMGGMSDYPSFGGLIGYAPDQIALWAHLADYVDRVFRGANPGDLPVEQPTKLELVINRKAAAALGLTIPPDLLVLADKVIE